MEDISRRGLTVKKEKRIYRRKEGVSCAIHRLLAEEEGSRSSMRYLDRKSVV